MRLLDAEALIYDNVAELVEFPDESFAPPYAILSHTWEQEEVLFHDIPLGPQHEIQVSAASLRARRRQEASNRRDSVGWGIAELDDEEWDDDSIENSDYDEWDGDSTDRVTLASRPDSEDFDGSEEGGTNSTVSYSQPDCTSRESVRSSIPGRSVPTYFRGNSLNTRGVSDFGLLEPHVKAGWSKVLNACVQTLRDGLAYIWIDTCCIDKSSSAELSEAINSMYRWYGSAQVCYAYLWDCRWRPEPKQVLASSKAVGPQRRRHLRAKAIGRRINGCRWFTRGWTLQELIAPIRLCFFDHDWQCIDERDRIPDVLEKITGIHRLVLCPGESYSLKRPSDYSVAQRMFWASKRQTTREEDEAYCLLGIFGINMPLLYGEGKQAFQRLQHEILRTSTDQSVFAWELLPHVPEGSNRVVDVPSLLAPAPANFYGRAQHIVSYRYRMRRNQESFRFTNEGIEIELELDAFRIKNGEKAVVAALDCMMDDSQVRIGIWLQIQETELARKLTSGQRIDATFLTEYIWEGSDRVIELPYFESFSGGHLSHPLLIAARPMYWREYHDEIEPEFLEVQIGATYTSGGQISREKMWDLIEAYPPFQWQMRLGTIRLPLVKNSFVAIALYQWIQKRSFVIVIGTKFEVTRPGNVVRNNVRCRYWILPVRTQGHHKKSVKGNHKYLHMLCERAVHFELKDYYENTTKREESNKILRLRSGEFVSANFHDISSWPGRRKLLEFEIELLDNLVPRATEEDSVDQSYFQIDRLRRSLYPRFGPQIS